MRDNLRAYASALEVMDVDGEIAITGPDGVAISLTREAAIESARRLLAVARGDSADGDIYQKPLG